MKKFFILTLFLIASSIIDENILKTHFASFKSNYNKDYPNTEVEEKKYLIFKNNFEKYGKVNQFSDIADYDKALEELKLTGTLPEGISYISYLGDAKYQDGCRFCYVFSFIPQVEAQYAIKFGKTYRFAEQELLDCSNKQLAC